MTITAHFEGSLKVEVVQSDLLNEGFLHVVLLHVAEQLACIPFICLVQYV